MADNNIDLTANFDTSKAINSINNLGSEASKSIDGINKSVDGFSKTLDSVSRKKIDVDTKTAESSLENLRSKIALIGAGLAGYFTFQAATGFFDKVVSEAIDAENNLNQLNAALARNGQLTIETSSAMSKFASDMMAVSTIDDDVISGQLAIAMNFTKSADKARDLVSAAMNLSAAMKIDLGTAVELLGRTLDGTAGRLNETVPALRGVSAEALKSGEAIKIVNEQFAGAAASEVNTYSGSLSQLSNVFGNFAASIGNMIIQNPMVIQSIKELSLVFSQMTGNIEDGTNESISFVNRGITALISGFRDLLPNLNNIASFFKSISLLFDVMTKGIMSFVDGLKILGNTWLWLVGTMEGKKSALKGIDEALDRMRRRGDELSKALENIGKDAFSKIDLKALDDALKRIQDAAKNKPIQIPSNVNANIDKNKIAKDLQKAVSDAASKAEIDLSKLDLNIPIPKKEDQELFTKDQLQEMGFEQWFNDLSDYLDNYIIEFNKPDQIKSDELWSSMFGNANISDIKIEEIGLFQKAINSLKATASFIWNAAPIIQGITYLATKSIWKFYDYIRDNFSSLATNFLGGTTTAVTGIIGSITQGAEGAKKSVTKVIGDSLEGIAKTVGSIFGPIGGAIGQLVGGILNQMIQLTQIPKEEFNKKVKEFFDAVPSALSSIIENLPNVAEKLAQNINPMILKLLEALPKIFLAIAEGMDELAESMAYDAPKWGAFWPKLLAGIVEAFARGFVLFARGVIKGFGRLITEKMNEVNRIMGEKMNAIAIKWNEKKDAVIKAIKSISITNFQSAIEVGIEKIKLGIISFFNNLFSSLSNLGNFLVNSVSSIASGLLPFLKQAVLGIFNGIIELAKSLFKNFDFSSLSNSIQSVFLPIIEKIRNLGLNIFQIISSLFNSIGDFFQKLIEFFTNKSSFLYKSFENIANAISSIANLFRSLPESIKSSWDIVIRFISNIPNYLMNAINSLFNFFAKIPSFLWESINSVFNFFAKIPTTLWSAIMSVWYFFASIPKMLYNAIKGIFDIKIGGGSKNGLFGGKIVPGVLATGGVVPSGYPNDTYPALLTSNETVIPASSTPNLFKLIDQLSRNETNTDNKNLSNEETNNLLRQLITIISSQQKTIEVKLERDTLAKAMVSLNKDNRRLA